MIVRWLRIQLWFLVVGLCCFGLVMIASTTTMMGHGKEGLITYSFLVKQAIAMAAGAMIAVGISSIGTERLRQGKVIGIVVLGTIIALIMVLLVGREVNGAKRWIDLGPINVQPAEMAKFALVVAAAWYLTQVAERSRSIWYGVILPALGFAVIAGLVYATKDLGSVVVMALVLVVMMSFAKTQWLFAVGMGILCMPVFYLLTIQNVLYRKERFLAFLDPWNSEGPAAYHLQQSLIAIGSGGLTGVGLGQSTAKLNFLPEKHTDFIFSIVCEELGMVGALAVAGAFLLLVITGFLIANQAKDRYLRLLAVGATLVLGTQSFWNMLVVMAVVPTKGLTLPFISYGGSSVVICLALVGILDAVAQGCLSSKPHHTTTRIGAKVNTKKPRRWHASTASENLEEES